MRRYRGCTNGRSTTFVHRARSAHTVSAQWPLTAPRAPIPSFAQKVSSYLLPPGLPNSTGGALPAALPHSPALSPPTQTTLIYAFISPFRRVWVLRSTSTLPAHPEQCVNLPNFIRHAFDSSRPLEPRMSRSQIGIDRLPARRMTSEPRESMNCKSCRKRKVVVRAFNSNVVADCV